MLDRQAHLARAARHWAIPADARARPNPVPVTAAMLTDARAHFVDHCAVCHGNDGRGNTPMGRNLYPRAPDMRLPEPARRKTPRALNAPLQVFFVKATLDWCVYQDMEEEMTRKWICAIAAALGLCASLPARAHEGGIDARGVVKGPATAEPATHPAQASAMG